MKGKVLFLLGVGVRGGVGVENFYMIIGRIVLWFVIFKFITGLLFFYCFKDN